MTFCEPKEETSADEGPQRECSTSLEMGDRGLGLPPSATSGSAGHRQSMSSKLSIKNYEKWLEWQAWQLDTPHWWEELTTIPDVEDIWRLAQKIWASFELSFCQDGGSRRPAVHHTPCAEMHLQV